VKYPFRFLVLLVAGCSLTAATTPDDLSGYDTLGPLEQKAWESPVAIERQVRKFVWDHWNGKRRGYVAVTFYTKEGEPTTEFLWVEPAAAGSWHIRGKIESTYSDRLMVTDPNKQPDRHETRTFEAVRIVRVGKGVNAHLAFKDTSGETVGSF
jgi:hypothetical protein